MRAYAVSATVTNGSPNVTCTGAALLANAYEGDALLLPNGTSWPIKSVNSNTSITLEGNFVGTGGTYAAFITRRNDAWVSSAQVNLKYSQALEALLRGYTLMSPTSLAIGAGLKAFTTQGDAPILPGARVRASSNANPTTHWMEGVVTTYAGGVMTLSVDVFAGSGSRADWSLNLAGARGAIGAAVSVPVSTTINNLVGWDAANGGALKDMGSFASLLAIHGREVLTAHRTYYVRTNGNDGNTGLADTAGGAFATLQRALDVASRLDFNGYIVTIQLADGTYTASGAIPICVGQTQTGNLVIKGNAATPGNVILSVTSASCISATVPGAGARITDLELRATTTGYGLHAENGAAMEWGNIRFGACASSHIIALRGGKLSAIGNYAIVGGAQCHFQGDGAGGQIECGSRSITLTGTPNFSVAFAWASSNAVLRTFLNTYSGAATGPRYSATTGGGIQTFGGGANAFPGSSAGAVSAPGWYS